MIYVQECFASILFQDTYGNVVYLGLQTIVSSFLYVVRVF